VIQRRSSTTTSETLFDVIDEGNETVIVTHFGGAREVGATSYAVEVFGVRVLVDMGLRARGAGADRWGGSVVPDWTNLGRVDIALLTHAHNDHQGALPILCRERPDLDVFCTPETADLTDYSLRDGASILAREAKNKGVLPLYTRSDVGRACASLCELPMYTELVLHRNGVEVRIEAIPAGHILGAASFHVRFVHPDRGEIRVSMNGDLSHDVLNTIPGFDKARYAAFRPHVMVSEGTYGMEKHPPIAEERTRLRRMIAQAIRRGGPVLIPAFAIGRAQEVAFLMYDWNQRWVDWCIEHDVDHRVMPEANHRYWDICEEIDALPWVPTYVDGLARNVTDLYEMHPERLAPALQIRFAASGRYLWSKEYNVWKVRAGMKQRILDSKTPFVVIAPSGMLAGGVIVPYILHFANDPLTLIAFQGYVDCEAPGWLLTQFEETPPGNRKPWHYPMEDGTFGQVIIACEVASFRLSGHASGQALVELYEAAQPTHLILAHGNSRNLDHIRRVLTERMPDMVVRIPRNGDNERCMVRPDAPTRSVLTLRQAEPSLAERFASGVTPEAVYRLTYGVDRAPLFARDIALKVFGSQTTRAARARACQLVDEVLEAYRDIWFDEDKNFDTLMYTAKAPNEVAGWPEPRPGGFTDVWGELRAPVVAPGYALVRHLHHFPRVALLGPATPLGVRRAIVAMTSVTHVSERDIIAGHEAFPSPAWWNDPVDWDLTLRRSITEDQLEAERILDGEGSRIHATHEVQQQRKLLFAEALKAGAAGPLSLGAENLITFLSEAMSKIMGEPIIVRMTTRELREALRFGPLMAGADREWRELLSIVNEVRACLGMIPLETTLRASEFPFDVRRAWNEAVATAQVPEVQEPPMSFHERLAVLLHDARVLAYLFPRIGVVGGRSDPQQATPA
jgi:predicted metal-dependent RNase